MRARLVAPLAAGVLSLTSGPLTTSALAAPHHSPPNAVGGPLLASKGVVEQPLAGAPALPAPSALPASSWLVANLTTGAVLAAKDPHGRSLPASTLKTLTALTLIPRLDPSEMFKVPNQAARVDGTKVGLVPGMRYSISKLFTCMLVMSANDAADALSEANGGIAHTVAQMNLVARHLQADDTHADTPSGLDGPGETTSAYDLALIAKAEYQLPAFRHYVSLATARVPAPHHKHFQIQSHNNLLTTYRGDVGGKNGYTVAAHATYVGVARRHGQTLVVALMDAYPIWWPMARDLLNWGFKANGKVEPVGALVTPLSPGSAEAAVQRAAANNVLINGRPAAPKRNKLPWFPIEVVVAFVIALGLTGLITRRRRSRRRAYRPRLRLPPI
jgi:D-alanyl-D-alanine carboxypeptidase (penicillin-binding protein 5/6)